MKRIVVVENSHGGEVVEISGGGDDTMKVVLERVSDGNNGEMVVERAAVGGHSTDETRFSGSMNLHAHRRQSGSNHRSWYRAPEKPRALIPTDATERRRTRFYIRRRISKETCGKRMI